MFDFLDWMPEQASTFAAEIDFINQFINDVAFISTVGISGVMLIIAYVYRRRPGNEKTPYITHSTSLETLWTAVPTVACLYCFYIGTASYMDMRTVPANPVEVNVEAFQWGWTFHYPTGKKSNELVTPIDTPVRLVMQSTDVNHSFFVPAMRVKEDVIAGAYHYLWFTPIKTGEFPIYCTEYCGKNHSGMLAKLRVVEREVYQDFINDRTVGELTPEESGKKVFAVNGCASCHSLDGSRLVGPSLKAIFGRSGTWEDGGNYTVDENYIRESILEPNKRIVKGFPPGMRAYKLPDKDINDLIVYLKTVK